MKHDAKVTVFVMRCKKNEPTGEIYAPTQIFSSFTKKNETFVVDFNNHHFCNLAVYRNISDLNYERTVVTVGSFDGVHCGHRMLLRRVVDLAALHRIRSVVLTFWPHPQQILYPKGDSSLLLNTLDERITLLQQTGVDDVVVFSFDRELSQMPASGFIRDIIIGKMNARYIVMGQDHHFGKDRSGDLRHLPEFVAHSDLQIEVVDLKMLDQKISSSAIRKALLGGDLELANKMLGYEYIISGKVIAGNQLGRTIGFPTANIETPAYKLLPKEGVYRVKVKLTIDNQKSKIKNQKSKIDNQKSKNGMLYIGKRTVLKKLDTKPQVEVHIFDFNEQIYGQEISLALTHRIRDDIKFENVGQLAKQLHRDKQNIINKKVKSE